MAFHAAPCICRRVKFLWSGVCYERLCIKNFQVAPVSARLTVHFEADFADIFEVRGTKRKHKGQLLDPLVTSAGVTLAYQGLDGVRRRTMLAFSRQPAKLTAAEARFDVNLPSQAELILDWTVACECGNVTPKVLRHEEALGSRRQRHGGCPRWLVHDPLVERALQ